MLEITYNSILYFCVLFTYVYTTNGIRTNVEMSTDKAHATVLQYLPVLVRINTPQHINS